MNNCQVCGGKTASLNQKTCSLCVEHIMSQGLSGVNMGMLAKQLGLTRNATIGIFNRNKQAGQRHPADLVRKRPVRRPKVIYVQPVDDVDRSEDPDPREIRQCLWVYGHPGEDWHYCHEKKHRGSSYCYSHYTLSIHPSIPHSTAERRGVQFNDKQKAAMSK